MTINCSDCRNCGICYFKREITKTLVKASQSIIKENCDSKIYKGMQELMAENCGQFEEIKTEQNNVP